MPAFAELLVVRRPSAVFTAPQSLVFVVGTSLVTTLARGARTIGGAEPGSVLPTLICALLVGAFLLALSLIEPDCRPGNGQEWMQTVGSAVVNSMLLFVAALGVEKF